MPPWVSATQVSSGSRGSTPAARSLRSSRLPTWGPLPWVTTSGRSVRWARWWAVSMVRSYCAGIGLALPGGEMAFPPSATTASRSRTRSSWLVTAALAAAPPAAQQGYQSSGSPQRANQRVSSGSIGRSPSRVALTRSSSSLSRRSPPSGANG